MFCNMCGQRLPDDSKFCINCGGKVAVQNPKTTQVHQDTSYRYIPPKAFAKEVIYETGKRPDILNTGTATKKDSCAYCNNCGAMLKPDTSFCTQCGKQIQRNSKPYESCGKSVPQNGDRISPNDAIYSSMDNAPLSSRTNRAANGLNQEKTKLNSFSTSSFGIFRRIVITILVLGILFVVSDKIDERNARKRAEEIAAAKPTEATISPDAAALAERLPDVPEHLQTLQILQHRGMGSCKELTGDVAINVVFVDDAVSSWTEKEIDEFTGDLYIDVADLTHQAGQWGIWLNITIYTKHCTLDYEIEPESASAHLGTILSAAGYDFYELNKSLKEETNADAVPFVMVFNKDGRSHATQDPDENRVQACYLFSGSYAFKHELLHLFGASDFYYHDLMNFGALDILDGSIMVDSTNDYVDDLTAYLVGWTNQLTGAAEGFLYLIDYIGNDKLQAAAEANMFTGFGTYELGGGVSYSGYLAMGVPDGWGEMVFPDGSVYNGEFENGAITGYGFYTWGNGGSYEGEFLEGQRHGQGTQIEPNGEIYSGKWEYDTFIG